MQSTKRIKVIGKVQGVYFRKSTKQQANKYSIAGYVRNMPDGSVEAVCQGEQENIDKFIEWCKIGPKSAIVEKVIIEDCDSIIEKKFEIRYKN